MKAVHGRFTLVIWMMLSLGIVVSGCTVGGKSFAIDSNSRVPFFGLELKERKPKATAPAYRSIARLSNDESAVKTALHTQSAGEKVSWGDRKESPVSMAFPAAVTTSSDPTLQAARASRGPEVKSIPLPVSGDDGFSPIRRTVSPSTDFQ